MSDSELKIENLGEQAEQVDGPARSDAFIGHRFDQRFEVKLLLGTGATGTTYKAFDSMLQRDIALKIIHSHLLFSPKAVDRFKQEAITSTSLNHPNICKTYSQGADKQGRLYIVMDCLQGESLAKYLQRVGKIDLDNFFLLFSSIIDALEYAHQQGVIHRDIKPSNIVINNSENLKETLLVDFGLAKWIDQSNEQGNTQTGALLGSSAYMSPEQCIGSKALDERSDIYSLGCVMLETLTGSSPFQGESPLDVMYKHLNQSAGQLGFLKELPDAISNMIGKCLQKNRENRYQKTSELKLEFDQCYKMQDTIQRRWKQKNACKQSKPRKRLTYLAVATALLVFAALNMKNKLPQDSETIPSRQHTLRPVDKAVFPTEFGEFSSLLQDYAKRNPEEALLLAERWEKERANKLIEKNRVQGYAALAGFYAGMDNFAKMKHCCREVLTSNAAHSYSTIVIMAITRYYASHSRYSDGIKELEKLRKEFPFMNDSAKILNGLRTAEATLYLELGKLDKAIELCAENENQSMEQEPSTCDNTWRHCLIVAYGKKNQADKMQAMLDRCEQSAMNDKSRKKDEVANVFLDLGIALKTGNQYAKSVEYLKRAKALYHETKNTHREYDSLFLIRGALKAQGLLKESLAIEKEILSLTNDDILKIENFNEMHADALALHDLSLARSYNQEALKIWRQLVRSRNFDFNSENKTSAETAIGHQCNLFFYEGKNTEALSFLLSELNEIRKLGGDSLLLARLTVRAGFLHNSISEAAEAFKCARDAREILRNPALVSSLAKHKIDRNAELAAICNLEIQCYGLAQDHAKAAQSAAAAVKLREESKFHKPGDEIPCKIMLAIYLYASNQKSEAEKTIASIEKERKERSHIWEELSLEDKRRYADYKAKAQDYRLALIILDECIQTISKNKQAVTNPYCYYVDRAVVLVALRQPAKAIAELEAILANQPKLPRNDLREWDCRAFATLHEAAMRLKDYSRAILYEKKYIELAPDHYIAGAYQTLANCYRLTDKNQEAASTIEEGIKRIQAIKLDKTPIDLSNFELELAKFYLDSGELAQAESHAGKAESNATNIKDSKVRQLKIANANRLLGEVLARQGKVNDARVRFKNSADLYSILGKEGKAGLKTCCKLWIDFEHKMHNKSAASEIEKEYGSVPKGVSG